MVNNNKLTVEQVHEFVSQSKFKLDEKSFTTYIPPHVNQRELVTTTAQQFGLELDEKKAESFLKDNEEEIANVPTTDRTQGAFIQVRGDYSIPLHLIVNTAKGPMEQSVYLYHETLMNKKNHLLAHELIEKKVIKLFDGADEEYLYMALSETTENMVNETAQKMAHDIPVYFVNFKDDGSFTVKDYGIMS